MKAIQKNITISRLADLAEVNVQTIRYYERRELLKPSSRSSSGYRYYNDDSLKRVKFIKQAQDIGFRLEEISGLLDIRSQTPNQCKKASAQAKQKLGEVQGKIKNLKSMEKKLKQIINACEKNKKISCCPMIDNLEVIRG